MNFSAGYADSIFLDFENYLRNKVDLVEDDIGLVLNEHSSIFISDEKPPGVLF